MISCTSDNNSDSTILSTEIKVVKLKSQQQVNDFNFTKVTLRLSISGNDITDLTPLASLVEVGNISIIGTNVQSLAGLHNVVISTNNTSDIELVNNSLLEDISALGNIANNMGFIIIEDSPSLTNITGLGIKKNGGSLRIKNAAVSNLNVFTNANSMFMIILIDCPNIVNFNGFNNLVELVEDIDIKRLNSLESFEGLENLNSMDDFYIKNCPQLNALDGLDNLSTVQIINFFTLPSLQSISALNNVSSYISSITFVNLSSLVTLEGLNNITSSGHLQLNGLSSLENLSGLESLKFLGGIDFVGSPLVTNLDPLSNLTNSPDEIPVRVVIVQNTSLSDYCGLTQFMTNVTMLSDPYNSTGIAYYVIGNAYNPTYEQIRSSTECSQ